MRARTMFGLATLLLPALSGCSFLNRATVESLGTSAQKPSNVAAFMAVSDGDEPVTELEANDFRVYENEQLLTPEQTQQVLLDRNLVAAHHLVLLVDLSTAKTRAARTAVAKGVAGFVSSVQKHQAISVFAFDGGPELALVGQYARGAAAAVFDTSPIESFEPGDGSRNLNGAVVLALRELEARLSLARKPLRVGTLVVFTRGPDLAGRVAEAELGAAFDRQRVDTLAILVGEETTTGLAQLGKHGVIRAQSADTIPIAFEDAAIEVNATHERYYLLAYCSPGRAGPKNLRIEVEFSTREGERRNGDFYSEFETDGFGPGCNPEAPPRFVQTSREHDR